MARVAQVTAQDARPQGRRRDPARRARQAPAQPDAGQLPARPAPVPGGRRAGGGVRGRGAGPRRQLLVRAHHPPGHADLRHARARLQVDARGRQGRPGQPPPRGQVDQRAPRRLAQLPAQPRVQPLVHDRRRARLAARAGGHARGAAGETGAESIRQLPTLRLFKIRMDLEMEEGTEALAKEAEAVDSASPRPSRCRTSTWP